MRPTADGELPWHMPARLLLVCSPHSDESSVEATAATGRGVSTGTGKRGVSSDSKRIYSR